MLPVLQQLGIACGFFCFYFCCCMPLCCPLTKQLEAAPRNLQTESTHLVRIDTYFNSANEAADESWLTVPTHFLELLEFSCVSCSSYKHQQFHEV